MIKNIVFDFGGVIVDIDRDKAVPVSYTHLILVELLRIYGISIAFFHVSPFFIVERSKPEC